MEKPAEKFIIKQSGPLRGTVRIGGAKNAVLPVLAGVLLTQEHCIIRDVPNLSDVEAMCGLLTSLGVEVTHNGEEGVITAKVNDLKQCEAGYDLVGKLRASFLIMGPLLARLKKVKVPLPGGCAIGTRPVDLHLKGMAALGAQIEQSHGYMTARAEKLKGAKIYLDFPSVGATENILMAAVFAEGQTIIENCASEPEIVDLANFLNAAGADIRGAGTDTVKVNGVKSLKGTDHTVIPDRIEAGTYMVASAITLGDLHLTNIVMDHVKPVTAKLKEVGIQVEETPQGIRVFHNGNKEIVASDIKTLPYPGFPTDMQAVFMSLLATASGTSIITESIFENRFMQVGELKRMGADIKIEGRSAVVEAVSRLTGAQVRATDLRAGAALVLAALKAEGATEISDVYHIDRGYQGLDAQLRKLGADVSRC